MGTKRFLNLAIHSQYSVELGRKFLTLMDYHGKGLWDEEIMSHNWGSLMSPLSITLSCIYISTILHDILLCQSGQGYGYFWQVNSSGNPPIDSMLILCAPIVTLVLQHKNPIHTNSYCNFGTLPEHQLKSLSVIWIWIFSCKKSHSCWTVFLDFESHALGNRTTLQICDSISTITLAPFLHKLRGAA